MIEWIVFSSKSNTQHPIMTMSEKMIVRYLHIIYLKNLNREITYTRTHHNFLMHFWQHQQPQISYEHVARSLAEEPQVSVWSRSGPGLEQLHGGSGLWVLAGLYCSDHSAALADILRSRRRPLDADSHPGSPYALLCLISFFLPLKPPAATWQRWWCWLVGEHLHLLSFKHTT